jgi:large subunit ribosomal protein L13
MKRTSTYFPKPGEVDAKWRVIDATGQTLGRIARDIAVALQGKDKAAYTPHTLTGDFVVVLNASRIRVTGRKLLQKTYYRHSGYVGNLKSFKLRDVLESHPERVISLAVKGMLPRNHQGRQMLRRLKVFAGGEHPHQAQVQARAEPQAAEAMA